MKLCPPLLSTHHQDGGAAVVNTRKMTSQEYLDAFKIQENLEELINTVLKERPDNPFEAMAAFLSSCKV